MPRLRTHNYASVSFTGTCAPTHTCPYLPSPLPGCCCCCWCCCCCRLLALSSSCSCPAGRLLPLPPAAAAATAVAPAITPAAAGAAGVVLPGLVRADHLYRSTSRTAGLRTITADAHMTHTGATNYVKGWQINQGHVCYTWDAGHWLMLLQGCTSCCWSRQDKSARLSIT